MIITNGIKVFLLTFGRLDVNQKTIRTLVERFKAIKALQLGGMSKRTQQCYTRSVRMLVQHYDKSPELITEDELQEALNLQVCESNWAMPNWKPP